jgi:hypothetical protein
VRRFLRHTAAGILAIGIGTGALFTFGGTGGAASLLPIISSTTVTSVPFNPVTVGEGVEVTANIKPLNLALGVEITPTGTVAFSAAPQGSPPSSKLLGYASVPKCLAAVVITVTACTAVLVTYPTLSPGTWVITASYSGDTLVKSSVGAALLSVVAPTDDNTDVCTDVTPGYSCGENGDVSPDGTTQLSVDQYMPTGGNDTITVSYGGPALSCGTEGPPGDIANWDTTDNASSDEKTIYYTILGADATSENAEFPPNFENNDGALGGAELCYGSTLDFTTAGGTLAPWVNGEYEGLLPYCNDSENIPCLDAFNEGAGFFAGGDGNPPSFTFIIDAAGGDPRAGGH